MPAPFDAIVRGCLEPDYRTRISLEGIRNLLEPAPVAHEAPREEARPRRSRGWIAIAALALVVCGLAVAWWSGHRAGTTPPVAPVAARAVPPMESEPARPEARKEPEPAPIQAKPAVPAEPVGRADFFGDDLEGHPTASGEMFSNQAMAAASQDLPLGTRLRVTNLKNGHSAIVRVNDRGVSRRFIIRVTRRVAEQLGFVNAGSATVKLQVLK